MAILVVDCPRCRTARASLRVIGASAFPDETGQDIGLNSSRQPLKTWQVSAGFMCPACHKPSAGVLERPPGFTSYSEAVNHTKALVDSPVPIQVLSYNVQAFWPEPAKPQIPGHVPEAAGRALLQAERNFPVEGNEDAAGAMYRKALDVALSHRFPDVKGNLKSRIDKLVKAHELTPQIGEWAHEIRLIGNDAAHDEEPVERPDLIAMRGFVDAVLRYVFTLPGEIEKRKAKVDEAGA